MSGSYRDLEIYGMAHSLGVVAHKFSLQLPRYEIYEMGSQLRRASKSISANIVEGYGRRRYKQEFLRYLVFAQASCDETAERVTYARDCHAELAPASLEVLAQTEGLGRRLNKFIQAVEKSHRSEK